MCDVRTTEANTGPEQPGPVSFYSAVSAAYFYGRTHSIAFCTKFGSGAITTPA